MGSFYEFVATLKDFLYVGYLKFPMIITGTLMILGLAQVNTAYLFLTLGIFALFFGVFLLQLLFSALTVSDELRPWLAKPTREVCSILDEGATKLFSAPSTTRVDPLKGMTLVTPSYYLSFVIFFFSYIFFNALHLYNKDPGPAAASNPDGVNNRQYQAVIGMILCIVALLAFLVIRYYFFSCETGLGFILSLPAGYFAYLWYSILVDCGEDRMSDMFGIIGRLLPQSMDSQQPVACVAGSN
jgi:hypothetical protein